MVPITLASFLAIIASAVAFRRTRRVKRRKELVATARRRREERERTLENANMDETRSAQILGRTREIAHDFDELLTFINGSAQRLRHEPDAGPGARAIVAEIRRAGEKAVRLNRQLLALDEEFETPGSLGQAIPETKTGLAGTVVSTRETILLVEDEDLIRSLAHRVLESRGYRVFSAPCAADALALHGRVPGKVDLVLTDVVMPGLGGREMAERLSAAQPDLRVLYMSGFTNDVVLEEGITAEAVHFLQKPFSPDTLARKVRDVLCPA